MECRAPKVKHDVIYGFGVIRTCQCKLADGHKCDALLEDVENGGGDVCVGSGGKGNFCIFLLIFL